ncbi:MAG: hypothetical protein OEV06_09695, partial [Anaerolineae bacterium]|nr:hypothetical protein [Anaerolineae bacterium]
MYTKFTVCKEPIFSPTSIVLFHPLRAHFRDRASRSSIGRSSRTRTPLDDMSLPFSRLAPSRTFARRWYS